MGVEIGKAARDAMVLLAVAGNRIELISRTGKPEIIPKITACLNLFANLYRPSKRIAKNPAGAKAAPAYLRRPAKANKTAAK